MTEDEWDSVIRVHLKGHFNTTHFAAAHWREPRQGGRRAGLRPDREHLLGGVPRGLRRAAQLRGGERRNRRLTTSTALALAKYGVTANAICPRARTRMTEDVFGGLRAAGRRAARPAGPRACRPARRLFGLTGRRNASTGSCSSCTAGWSRSSNARGWPAKFDSKQDAFTYDELDALLTPHYADRPGGRDVRGGGGAGSQAGLTGG